MSAREEFFFEARLAEQIERYDDMVDSMRALVELGVTLTPDERSLFSIAFKNVIGTRRNAWRVLNTVKAHPDATQQPGQLRQIETYASRIGKEIRDVCTDVLRLLNLHLVVDSPETSFTSGSGVRDATIAQVFYRKMKGDYYRYLSEVTLGDEHDKAVRKSRDAYDDAFELAENSLPAFDPLRLGLSLSRAVFAAEILHDTKTAVNIARSAFDQAVAENIQDLPVEQYKEATSILQLIRENLGLWMTSEEDDDNGDE